MKGFRRILFYFAVLILCVFTTVSALADEELQTDDSAAYPQRIAVFDVGAGEILLDLIGPEQIICINHNYFENGELYSPTMEMTKGIPFMIEGIPDFDLIPTLQPDLIVRLAENGDYETKMPWFYEAGVPELNVHMVSSIDDIIYNIHLLGDAVGEREKADKMVQDMLDDLEKITAITSQIPEDERVSALVYDSYQEFFGYAAEFAGVNSVLTDNLDYWTWGNEIPSLILYHQPDIIFVYPYDIDWELTWDVYYRGLDFVRDRFCNDPNFSAVPAVQNDRILPMYKCTSHYFVDFVEYLAKTAYPELFGEIE